MRCLPRNEKIQAIMKKLAAFLVLLTIFLSALPAPPRDDLWKKVDDANKKGLPKTAIKHLKDIEKSTLEDKAHAAFEKAHHVEENMKKKAHQLSNYLFGGGKKEE